MKRLIPILLLLIRLGGLGCFLFSGGLAVKEYGPAIFSDLRSSVGAFFKGAKESQNLSDPLALAMKEMESRQAFGQSGQSADGQVEGETAGVETGTGDDPSKYIKGGMAASEGGEIDEEALNRKNAQKTGREKLASTSEKTGSGDLDKLAGLSSLANLQQRGGIDQQMAGAIGSLSRAQTEGSGGAFKPKVLGAAGGKKSARVAKLGITRGKALRSQSQSSRSALSSAARTGYQNLQQGDFQKTLGPSFGEGVTTDKLNIPSSVGAIDPGLADGTLNQPNLNPEDYQQPDLNIDTERDNPYDEQMKEIATLVIASAAIGTILAFTKKAAMSNPWSKIVWWIAFIAGVGLALAAAAQAVSLMSSDDSKVAQAAGSGLSSLMCLPLLIAWVMLLAGEMGIAKMSFITTLGEKILEMITGQKAQDQINQAQDQINRGNSNG